MTRALVLTLLAACAHRVPTAEPPAVATPHCVRFDYVADGKRWVAEACFETGSICTEARRNLMEHGWIKRVRVGACR